MSGDPSPDFDPNAESLLREVARERSEEGLPEKEGRQDAIDLRRGTGAARSDPVNAGQVVHRDTVGT